jgi:hypothetical protein
LCKGKNPHDLICDGPLRKQCGADLVSYDEAPCADHALCTSDGSLVSCACEPYYYGDGETMCVKEADNCVLTPCQHAGLCNDDAPNAHTCDCTGLDWKGANCEIKIDDCAGKPCQNAGQCIDDHLSYSCDCHGTGFEGTTCTQNVNECAASNACADAYPCEDQTPWYTCRGQFPDWDVSAPINLVADVAKGLVTDMVTGLVWQRLINLPSQTDWSGAKAHCDGLVLAGYDDWRMPTVAEYASIFDYSKAETVDTDLFGSWTLNILWTASPQAKAPGKHWTVYPRTGYMFPETADLTTFVRCVR